MSWLCNLETNKFQKAIFDQITSTSQSVCLNEFLVMQALQWGLVLATFFGNILSINFFCLLILSQAMQNLVCFLHLVFVAVFHFVLPFLRQRNILRLNFIFISFSSLILKPFKYLWFPQIFFSYFYCQSQERLSDAIVGIKIIITIHIKNHGSVFKTEHLFH